MHCIAFLATTAIFAWSALAGTVNSALSAIPRLPSAATADIEPRGWAPGVYICSKPGFEGECTWHEVPDGKCFEFNYGAGASFGPDKGLSCQLYSAMECTIGLGEYVEVDGIEWPGLAMVGPYTERKGFKKPMSYMCELVDNV